MRTMTLETYAKNYLCDLTGQKSVSIHKLAGLANKNERIKNALIFYCFVMDKMRTLVKYLEIDEDEKELLLSTGNIIENQYKRYDFEKIYQSYHRYVNRIKYDNEIKASIRKNTLQIMKDKKISKYQIYNSLHLNPGNINDYLTNGNVSKVSLSTSKKIYQYCLSI